MDSHLPTKPLPLHQPAKPEPTLAELVARCDFARLYPDRIASVIEGKQQGKEK